MEITLKELSKFSYIECRKRANGHWKCTLEFEFNNDGLSILVVGYGNGKNSQIAIEKAMEDFNLELNSKFNEPAKKAFNK